MALDSLQDVGDDALMVLYANGDQTAAQSLALRHSARMMGLAYRMLNDQTEAEDIAQEALMRLWKIAPDWRQGEAKVSTWLYRVVSNMCTDRLRRKRGAALDDIPEPEDDAPSAEETLQQQARFSKLHTALNALPERQKLAVSLRHIDELSNPEIADVMEISVEAVESLTSRGRRALAKILAAEKDQLGYTT
ncbi:RNA polymerase sigma subunit ECF family protein [Amylibacter marinus]|uniref:RNA polymerase sigma subunit ECF family protein n=2 Tax=Amylibacter marinus TaxID=1475483 RepID=A0ABQ5VTE8_9RHOB|nr:RNA polymerase sigma subunit ECF family protein [Amylibacter marinus]